MDILNPADLKSLIAQQWKWCVSIYMPTHRAGQEQKQDLIRLKNLLAEAEVKLLANGLRRSKVQKLMQPAEELLWDKDFWHRQSDGLAIFLSNDFWAKYRLPSEFEELLQISKNFHIKPLVPLLNRVGKFYILTLSLQRIRLFRGTRDTIHEITLNIPASMNDAEQSRNLREHKIGDEEKKNILHFFQSVNEGLGGSLEDKNIPMILAGVDYLLPIYREACTYDNILEDGIIGSPDRENLKDLHEYACEITQPIFEENQKKASEKFEQLNGEQNTLATSDISTAVKAAKFGQVETLFVPLNEQKWGYYDAGSNEVILESEAGPENEDLLDLAVVETIMNSGQVFAVQREQLPGGGDLAAILRYVVAT